MKKSKILKGAKQWEKRKEDINTKKKAKGKTKRSNYLKKY